MVHEQARLLIQIEDRQMPTRAFYPIIHAFIVLQAFAHKSQPIEVVKRARTDGPSRTRAIPAQDWVLEVLAIESWSTLGEFWTRGSEHESGFILMDVRSISFGLLKFLNAVAMSLILTLVLNCV
ncbi:hypothetical protein B0H13DRAFT_1874978 [Mycena leptocephala]|nr:hypothetical protein B0H13DRAFT_1874978 [Mycena leptocephala]